MFTPSLLADSISPQEFRLFMALYTTAHLRAYDFVCTQLYTNSDFKESPLTTMIFYEYQVLNEMKKEIEARGNIYSESLKSAFNEYCLPIWEKNPCREFDK